MPGNIIFNPKPPLFKFNAISHSLMQHIFCEKENLAKQRLHKIYLAYKDNPEAILKVLDECVTGCRKCSEIYFACEPDNEIEKKRLIRNFSPEKILDWRDLYDDEVFAEYRSARNCPSTYVGFKAVLFLLKEKVKSDEMWKKVDLEGCAFDGEENSVFFDGIFERNIILAKALGICLGCKRFMAANGQSFGDLIGDWYKESASKREEDPFDSSSSELRIELFRCLLKISGKIDLDLAKYKFIFLDILKISNPSILFENIHYFAQLGLKQKIFAEMTRYDLNSVRSIVLLSGEIDFAAFFLNESIKQFYKFLSLNNIVVLNKVKAPEIKDKFQSLMFNTVEFLVKNEDSMDKGNNPGDNKKEHVGKMDMIEFICSLDWRSYGDLVLPLLYLRWFYKPFASSLRVSINDRKSDILTFLSNKKLINSGLTDQKYILEIMHDALNLRGRNRTVGMDLSKYVRMTPGVAIEFTKLYGTDEELLKNVIDYLLIQDHSMESFCNILRLSAPALLKNLKTQAILHNCGHAILKLFPSTPSQSTPGEMIVITSSSESLEMAESSIHEESYTRSKQIKIKIDKSKDKCLSLDMQPATKNVPIFDTINEIKSSDARQRVGFINIKKRKIEDSPKINKNCCNLGAGGAEAKSNCGFGKLKELAAKINENNMEKEAVIIDKRDITDVKLVGQDIKDSSIKQPPKNSSTFIRQYSATTDKHGEEAFNDVKDMGNASKIQAGSALTKSITDKCNTLFNNSKSYKTIRTHKSDDSLFYKNILSRPAENINEFYEECLNPLVPSYRFPCRHPQDTFLSCAEYVAYFNILRANENKSSILSGIFEYSKYYTSTVHIVNGGASVKTSRDGLELHDILFFSSKKMDFKNSPKECLTKEMVDGSFLGIVKRISNSYSDIDQEYRNTIEIQISEKMAGVKHGQFYYFKLAGNLITSIREFISLFNIHKSGLLKYILRPSFHQDNLDRRIFWDDKRSAIVVNSMANLHSPPRSDENSNTAALETLLTNFHALNPSQSSAVAHSFFSSERFCLIQGPPGTGKTTTILSIISTFLFLDGSNLSFNPNIMLGGIPQRRILVCAPSNTAIDIIVLRLAGGLKDFAGLKIQVPFVRVGNSPNDAVNQFTLEYISNSQFKNSKAKLRSKILDGSAVVCSTLSSSMSEHMQDYKFDLVIIDEACQSTELSAIIPLRYGPEKVIIIGDPCQLPPTVISNQPLLERSLFERMAVHHKPMLLNIQYRMNPSICDLSSTFFYNHKINTCDNLKYLRDKARGYNLSIACSPVNFVGVPSGNEKVDGSKSFYNYTEAALCLEIWKIFRQKYKSTPSVAILSPYKAQVNTLKAIGQFDEDVVDISTIDGYQGKEADIIILSTVRQTGLGFTSDFRRVNVAITRARECLIILGNSECLSNSKTWNGIINFDNLTYYSYRNRFQFFEKI